MPAVYGFTDWFTLLTPEKLDYERKQLMKIKRNDVKKKLKILKIKK